MVILNILKSLYEKYKIYIFIGGSILIVISLIIGYLLFKRETEVITKNLNFDDLITITSEEEVIEEKINYIGIDIKGAVKVPGYYQIVSDSRVIDVINLAGGLNENADTTVLNLSKKIVDEMVIIVYTVDEVKEFEKVLEKEDIKGKECTINKDIINDACVTNEIDSNENSSSDILININTASLEDLQNLSSIGLEKAKKIIEYRENTGPFIKIEDIMNVSGIGEAVFAKIKENITV